MQVVTGFALLGGLWFGIHAALWGVANTLDHAALVLHKLAGTWRGLHAAKSRTLASEWVRTLERAGTAPDAQDQAFLGRAGIRTDGYTGE